MSVFSDIMEGNWGNIGHDFSAHFSQDLPYYIGAATLGTGALGAAGIGPAAGLFGAGEAAAETGGALAAGEAAPLAAGEAAPLASYAPGGIGSDFAASARAGATVDELAYGGTAGGAGAPMSLSPGPAAAAPKPSFLDNIITGAESSIAKNPLGLAAAGAGLAYNLFRGNPTDPNQQQIQSIADQLKSSGAVLQNYLATGTLPPALAAQLETQKAAAKARIISGYAARGQNADPTQNSALAQELNSVDLQAVADMGNVQASLLSTGLKETGLSASLYDTLVKLDRESNTELMNAIASFAAAFSGGGGKGVNISLGGTQAKTTA
jgi:hypothetical protein